MSQSHENLNLSQAANPKPDIRSRPLAGNGIGVVPEISLKDIQEVQKDTEAAYIALMDTMEEGVRENGRFFIKVGHGDNRVLIFKKGRARKGTWGVVHGAITRGGQRKIHIKDDEWAKLSSRPYRPSLRDGLISDEPGKRLVRLGLGGDLRMILPITGAEGEKFIEETMSESINLSRREMEKRKKLGQKEQAKVKRLSDLLNQSPESSNGTGPAISPLR